MADDTKTSAKQLMERRCARFHALEVRKVDLDKREVDFDCSDESPDTYDTIIRQDWRLERYTKNPVVLYNHAGHEEDCLPIGQALNVRVEGSGGKRKLVCTVRFASEKANPFAEQCFQSVVEGTLRGISVGFIPHAYVWEMREDVEYLVFTDVELVELSLTPLPSNANALAKLRSAVAEERRAQQQISAPQRGAGGEPNMDEKEKAALEARASAAEDRANKAETRAAKAEASASEFEKRAAQIEVLEQQNKRLVEERDAASVRAEKAENEIIVRDVKALVGVKISPAEEQNFIDLRRANPDLFHRMVEQRTAMGHMKPAIPEEVEGAKPGATTTNTRDVSDLTDLVAKVEARASGASA